MFFRTNSTVDRRFGQKTIRNRRCPMKKSTFQKRASAAKQTNESEFFKISVWTKNGNDAVRLHQNRFLIFSDDKICRFRTDVCRFEQNMNKCPQIRSRRAADSANFWTRGIWYVYPLKRKQRIYYRSSCWIQTRHLNKKTLRNFEFPNFKFNFPAIAKRFLFSLGFLFLFKNFFDSEI